MRRLDLACPGLVRGDQRRSKSVIRGLGKKIIDEERTRGACRPLFSSRKDPDAAPPEETERPGDWTLGQIEVSTSLVRCCRATEACLICGGLI